MSTANKITGLYISAMVDFTMSFLTHKKFSTLPRGAIQERPDCAKSGEEKLYKNAYWRLIRTVNGGLNRLPGSSSFLFGYQNAKRSFKIRTC